MLNVHSSNYTCIKYEYLEQTLVSAKMRNILLDMCLFIITLNIRLYICAHRGLKYKKLS